MDPSCFSQYLKWISSWLSSVSFIVLLEVCWHIFNKPNDIISLQYKIVLYLNAFIPSSFQRVLINFVLFQFQVLMGLSCGMGGCYLHITRSLGRSLRLPYLLMMEIHGRKLWHWRRKQGWNSLIQLLSRLLMDLFTSPTHIIEHRSR